MKLLKNKILSFLLISTIIMNVATPANAVYYDENNTYEVDSYEDNYESDDYNSEIYYENLDYYDYYFKNFNVDVEINDKREYIVTETIDAYFNYGKHGITRNIPLNSAVEKVKIKDVYVEDDIYTTDISNGNLNIKIGDEHKKLKGDKRFVIHYTLKHYEDGVNNADYAYLDVLGTEWDTIAQNFTATVKYPSNFKFNKITVTSGYYGDSDNMYANYEIKDNCIFINSKGTIPKYTGITANIEFEEGAFINAPINYLKYLFYPLLIINLVILVVTILLALKSRNREKNIVKMVEFYPPEDMNPVEIGYLYYGVMNTKMIISCIYKWASDGYIKINLSDSNQISLTKIKDLDKGDYIEQDLFKSIFRHGKGTPRVVTEDQLEYKLNSEINLFTNKTKSKFKDDARYNLEVSKKSKQVATITCLLLSLSYTYLAFMHPSSIADVITAILINLVMYFVLISFRNGLRYNFNESFISNERNYYSLTGILGIYAVWNLLIYLCGFHISFIKNIVLSIPLIASIALSVLIHNAKSYEEEMLYGRICGFKDFIETVEKEKLEMILLEDENYFYNILPYAQVLGITKLWSDKFKNIDIKPSEYYHYNGDYYGFVNMSNSLTRTINNASSVRPSESSSGGGGSFSDGGFSGGGSGGGGGSSW